MRVSVIVTECFGANRFTGLRLVDLSIDNLDAALVLGDMYRANGRCVIVRPNYNEADEKGNTFFREWRSFNGDDLKEIAWSFAGMRTSFMGHTQATTTKG